MKTNLLNKLREEKSSGLKGDLFNETQIKFTYNTNRIEGSQLSEEQTRYIYETNTIFADNGETAVNVDDIIETINHFTCFDYLLEIANENLSEEHIKKFHSLLKYNTSDSKKTWFNIGEYKSKPNVVGGEETSLPSQVSLDIKNLLISYHKKKKISFEDIVDFHFQFERIHPFQDGNGRVGRLIMFKECLAHDILPFIIEDENKFFYYRGLKEYMSEKGYLTDTCLAAQDKYKVMVQYFFPDFHKKAVKCPKKSDS